uniref:Major histocompatibility complex class I-related gene protein-like n=1 Tax=Paramormyrops kingsleyae TaxID=1676925 RepID=A0A3B3SVR1_9TELE|nr:major histocompatibility complex class I-related gene protein-like isoform X2 [Paramormyrops kingsleyae]
MMMISVVVILVFCSFHLASQESHSLTLSATFISGETQFPGFIVVMKINDIPVEYYDGNIEKIVSRRYWRSDNTIEQYDLKKYIVHDFYSYMTSFSDVMKRRSNHTQGVHVSQEFVACDLEDDRLSRLILLYAYDGEEQAKYDILHKERKSIVPEFLWNQSVLDAMQSLFSKLYQPLCVSILRSYLQQDKNILLRRVHPKVRVMKKAHPGSGRTEVTCLATGFYPPCINMTLLRDGQPIPDREVTAGTVLPNGDGTYQQRRSLRVSDEELKRQYTCTVTHLSPENKLTVNLEAGPDSATLWPIIIPVLFGIIIIIAVVVVCWRRRVAKQGAI